jgi:1-acyl-sn-glycerol-3-phosphate acyltransferase
MRASRGLADPREERDMRAKLPLELASTLWAMRQPGVHEPMARAWTLRQLCRGLSELHGIDVRWSGELPERPSVVVCNHLGYLDPLILCSLLPLSPIAKIELASWPALGNVLARSNVIFVRRGDPYSGALALRRALRALAAGVSVLNFPEGTTTSGPLLPFRRGAFWLARRGGVKIVPVALRFGDARLCWIDDQAFLPHYCRLWTRKDRRVELVFRAPLDPCDFASDEALMLAAHASIALGEEPPSGGESAASAVESPHLRRALG